MTNRSPPKPPSERIAVAQSAFGPMTFRSYALGSDGKPHCLTT